MNRKRLRADDDHHGTRDDPAFIDQVNVQVFCLFLDFLPAEDVRQCAQVSKRWHADTQTFNDLYENKFKFRYADIHQMLIANHDSPIDWRHEYYSVSSGEKYIPLRFKKFKKFIFCDNYDFDYRYKKFKRATCDYISRFRGVTIQEQIRQVELSDRDRFNINRDLVKLSKPGLSETDNEIFWQYIESKERDNHNLLAWAMLTYQPEKRLKDLVNKITDVNISISHLIATQLGDCSLLHIAAYRGCCNIAEILIARGAIIDRVSDGSPSDVPSHTPLSAASRKNQIDMVILLIGSGADVNVDDEIYPAFLRACYEGNIEILKILIENNAKLDCCNSDNASCLYIAASLGYYEIVELLIKNHPKPESAWEQDLSLLFEFELYCSRQSHNDPIYKKSGFNDCHGRLKILIIFLNKLANTTLNPITIPSPKVAKYLLNIAQQAYPTMDEHTLEHDDISQLDKCYRNFSQLCFDAPDLLLLFAIYAQQSKNEIQRIINNGAKINESTYGIIPIDFANIFNKAAYDILCEATNYYDTINCTLNNTTSLAKC